MLKLNLDDVIQWMLKNLEKDGCLYQEDVVDYLVKNDQLDFLKENTDGNLALKLSVNALCDLNGWQRHKVIIGDGKSLNKEQAQRDADLKSAGAELSNQYFQREYGLQDGDLKEASALNQMQFSALPKHAFSFKADMQGLDANQREVDEGITKIDKQLFSETELLEVVEASSDVNDLQTRLYGLMSGESVEKFTATMARALYLFDVVGYVQRSK